MTENNKLKSRLWADLEKCNIEKKKRLLIIKIFIISFIILIVVGIIWYKKYSTTYNNDNLNILEIVKLKNDIRKETNKTEAYLKSFNNLVDNK